ncbi:MAG: CpsD/CapB family tyrosine-protein kinase [Evtepia sp.]
MHLNLFQSLQGRTSGKNFRAGFPNLDESPHYIRGKLLGEQSSFAANEAYKAARTNLMFTRNGEGCQTIAFTSTFPREGKTVTCCNLAISMSQNSQRVLIIDADMRKPMIANMFNIPNNLGLSEYLAGIRDPNLENNSLPFVPTQHPNLSVIPSGHIPPNPAELLASTRMKLLLEQAANYFDYIFIDTPPVSVVTDAAVLVKNVKGYVFVARAGVTLLEDLHDAVLKMDQVDANILGFMLNDLDSKSGSYKYTKSGSYKYKTYRRDRKYAYNLPRETNLDSERFNIAGQREKSEL